MKNILRRSLSWLLVLVTVLGLVPQTPVLAADETLAPPVEVEEAAPEAEEVPEIVPEEPAEEVSAEPEPEVPAPVEEPVEEVPEEVPEEAAGDELMATSGTCGDNLTWTLDDSGVLTISGTGPMTDYNSYENPSPWDQNADITSVVIGDGVTSVGSYAFFFCTGITSVTLPDDITSIGEHSFNYCWTLSGINLPDKLTSIGTAAFANCSNLSGIHIPEGITVLNDSVFNESGIESANIPDSVTTLGTNVFGGCSNLTSVTIGTGISQISDFCFRFCSSLTSVCIGDNITSIGNSAFDGCESLASVTIGDNVTYIGDAAFSSCRSLESIDIPDSVTTIDPCAFAVCDNLASITFCGDSPSIGDIAFLSVTATAYYPSGNTTWTEDVMQDYGGTITWTPYNAEKPTTPAKPHKITNVVSGVHVYWTAMDGISKYGLWRSETGKNGTYKWIANPTVPHFTDTKVESGKTYYYKVTAINPVTSKHSDKSEAIGLTYVGTPKITLRVNRAVGIGLGWEAIEGATGYAIYRKSYSGTDAWKRVATIPSGSTLAWNDTSVKNANGSVYKYTVRALAGSDMKTLSGCRNAGRTMVRLTSRALTSAAAASKTSIKCSWGTTSQATGYEVRFMVGSTVYKTYTIGNYKTGTKTFTGLPTGQTYKIQVRSYKKVGEIGTFYSAWSTAKNVKLG